VRFQRNYRTLGFVGLSSEIFLGTALWYLWFYYEALNRKLVKLKDATPIAAFDVCAQSISQVAVTVGEKTQQKLVSLAMVEIRKCK
jgi:hypothetical protein